MRLICQACKNGLYSYTEQERNDWENREMTCEKCGHKSSIKKLYDSAYNTMPDKDKDTCVWERDSSGKLQTPHGKNLGQQYVTGVSRIIYCPGCGKRLEVKDD